MKPLTIATTAVLISLGTGCAGKQKQGSLFPEYNIAEINAKSVHADSLSRTAVSKMEVLNGSLLTTRQELADLREEQSNISPARFEELETQLALLTEAFKDLYAIVAGIKVLPQIKYVPIKPSTPKAFNLSDAGDLILGEEQSLYQRAMSYYHTERFTECRQLLTSLVEQYPHGTLTDRAAFWIGETYYAEKNFGQAITAYASAEKFTGSAKGDDALFKEALCYVKLGENDTARERFNTLIGQFPASEYVDQSRKQIELLSL